MSLPGKRMAGLLMRPSKNQLMVVLQHDASSGATVTQAAALAAALRYAAAHPPTTVIEDVVVSATARPTKASAYCTDRLLAISRMPPPTAKPTEGPLFCGATWVTGNL